MDRRDYTDRVLSSLRRVTEKEREAIRSELDGHIEDHMEALRELGYDEELAEERAIAAMGEPDEVGRELNKQYPFRWLVAKWGAILLAVCIAFDIYVSDYYHTDPAAEDAMVSDDVVSVTEQNGNWVFAPESPTAGLIFYPGGKVENTAYAPLLHDLAEDGILCVLVKMPCNLAVLDRNAADSIPERFSEVTDWYIGGHSLGGAMAASYAAKHTDELDGLVLLAAYSTADLTDSGLRVYSTYGSEDGVLNREKYEADRTNLPQDTTETVIDGGCHAGFGSYGAQKGDGTPTISAEEQQQQTADEPAAWMNLQ